MPLARHLMAGMVALRADLNVCFIGSFSLKASGKMESKRTESICSQWVNESHFFRPPRQDFSLIGRAQETTTTYSHYVLSPATFDVSKVSYFYLNLQHLFLCGILPSGAPGTYRTSHPKNGNRHICTIASCNWHVNHVQIQIQT